MNKKRTFSDVWDVIDIAVYILIGYSLLELFFSVNSYVQEVFPAAILSFILTIVAYGSIGIVGLKEKLEIKDIAKHGAYAGLIIGFVGAILGIITFYVYPERFAEQIIKAVEAGADAAMVQTMIKIGTFANLVLGPAISAGIGALIAWLSSLIFKKKFESKKK